MWIVINDYSVNLVTESLIQIKVLNKINELINKWTKIMIERKSSRLNYKEMCCMDENEYHSTISSILETSVILTTKSKRVTPYWSARELV